MLSRKKRNPRTVEGASQRMQYTNADRLQIGDNVAIMTIDKFGRPRRAAMGEVWAVRSVSYVVKLVGAGDNVPIYYTKATLHATMARSNYRPEYYRTRKTPDYWLCKL